MDKHSADCNDNGKHQRHSHHHTEVDGQDIWAAKQAYLAYQSNDPSKMDFAFAERERIQRTDPKAWDIAMKQIDEEEHQSRRTVRRVETEETRTEVQTRGIRPNNLQETQLPPDQPIRPVRPVRPDDQRLNTAADGMDMPPPPYPNQQIPPRIEHPGYAPDSKFAPPTPDSPAYHAAYDRQPAKFYGLDLPFLKLGVTDRGSVRVGVNVGVAAAQVDAGLDNRVEGEFMPVGGPLHARVGAGIGVDRQGLHSEVGAGANVFNQVNGDADFGVRLGKTSGVAGDVRGKAVIVDAQGAAGASVGPEGADAYAGGNTHLGGKKGLGLRTGGEISASENSRMAAGLDLTAGNKAVTFGPALESHGNRTIDPDLNLRTQRADQPTFHPTGDRALDTEDLF